MDINEIQSRLADILPEKRYKHTLGVRYTCASLAMRYGIDVNKAELAGLLHDCAKYMSSKKILEICDNLKLKVTDFERQSPQLLHGRLGAYYAKNIYGIEDNEILTAIEYHTTGYPDMSLLSKILFIADYIEPGRKLIPGIKETRDVAFIDIDKAVINKFESVINYLESNSDSIDELSIRTYEFYKEAIK